MQAICTLRESEASAFIWWCRSTEASTAVHRQTQKQACLNGYFTSWPCFSTPLRASFRLSFWLGFLAGSVGWLLSTYHRLAGDDRSLRCIQDVHDGQDVCGGQLDSEHMVLIPRFHLPGFSTMAWVIWLLSQVRLHYHSDALNPSPHAYSRLPAVNILNLVLFWESVGKGNQVNATLIFLVDYPDNHALALVFGVGDQNTFEYYPNVFTFHSASFEYMVVWIMSQRILIHIHGTSRTIN